MDFSEPYPFAGPVPQLSPDGEYIAVVVRYRVLIRSCRTLRVIQFYSCLDRVQSLDWSPDSKYVLCCLKGRPIVQVWSIEEPDWNCKINEGPAGITGVKWCPDCRSILIVADFQIKATIWSLVDRKCVYIKRPKFSDKAIDFSHDGQTLLIAEVSTVESRKSQKSIFVQRYDCKDFITIFSTVEWKPKEHFRVETEDLGDAKWCPSNDTLAVWDSVLHYKILLYTIHGAKMGSYSAYSNALGIRRVNWSSTGRFIAAGSSDQVCRILDTSSWSPFLSCEHSLESVESDEVIIYKEVEDENKALDGLEDEPDDSQSLTKYIVSDLADVYIHIRTPVPDKHETKNGISMYENSHSFEKCDIVGLLCWSPSEKYLATKNDNNPNIVWIWDVELLVLNSIMVQLREVKFMEWYPNKDILAVCCGNSSIYLWSCERVSVANMPYTKFQVQKVLWSHQEPHVVLVENKAFCLGYLFDVE